MKYDPSVVSPAMSSSRAMAQPAESREEELGLLGMLELTTQRLREKEMTLEVIGCMEQSLWLKKRTFGEQSSAVERAYEELCFSYITLAMTELQKDNLTDSEKLLEKAEELTSPPFKFSRASSLRVKAMNNRACLYRKRGKVKSALLVLKEAARLGKEIRDDEHLTATHLNMAAILSQMGRHERALEHAEAAVFHGQEQLVRGEILQKCVETSSGSSKSQTITLGASTIANGSLCAATTEANSVSLASSASLSVPLAQETPRSEKMATLAMAYYNLAVELEFLRKFETCMQWYEKAVETAKAVQETSPHLLPQFSEGYKEALEQMNKRKQNKSFRMKTSKNQEEFPRAKIHIVSSAHKSKLDRRGVSSTQSRQTQQTKQSNETKKPKQTKQTQRTRQTERGTKINKSKTRKDESNKETRYTGTQSVASKSSPSRRKRQETLRTSKRRDTSSDSDSSSVENIAQPTTRSRGDHFRRRRRYEKATTTDEDEDGGEREDWDGRSHRLRGERDKTRSSHEKSRSGDSGQYGEGRSEERRGTSKARRRVGRSLSESEGEEEAEEEGQRNEKDEKEGHEEKEDDASMHRNRGGRHQRLRTREGVPERGSESEEEEVGETHSDPSESSWDDNIGGRDSSRRSPHSKAKGKSRGRERRSSRAGRTDDARSRAKENDRADEFTRRTFEERTEHSRRRGSEASSSRERSKSRDNSSRDRVRERNRGRSERSRDATSRSRSDARRHKAYNDKESSRSSSSRRKDSKDKGKTHSAKDPLAAFAEREEESRRKKSERKTDRESREVEDSASGSSSRTTLRSSRAGDKMLDQAGSTSLSRHGSSTCPPRGETSPVSPSSASASHIQRLREISRLNSLCRDEEPVDTRGSPREEKERTSLEDKQEAETDRAADARERQTNSGKQAADSHVGKTNDVNAGLSPSHDSHTHHMYTASNANKPRLEQPAHVQATMHPLDTQTSVGNVSFALDITGELHTPAEGSAGSGKSRKRLEIERLQNYNDYLKVAHSSSTDKTQSATSLDDRRTENKAEGEENTGRLSTSEVKAMKDKDGSEKGQTDDSQKLFHSKEICANDKIYKDTTQSKIAMNDRTHGGGKSPLTPLTGKEITEISRFSTEKSESCKKLDKSMNKEKEVHRLSVKSEQECDNMGELTASAVEEKSLVHDSGTKFDVASCMVSSLDFQPSGERTNIEICNQGAGSGQERMQVGSNRESASEKLQNSGTASNISPKAKSGDGSKPVREREIKRYLMSKSCATSDTAGGGEAFEDVRIEDDHTEIEHSRTGEQVCMEKGDDNFRYFSTELDRKKLEISGPDQDNKEVEHSGTERDESLRTAERSKVEHIAASIIQGAARGFLTRSRREVEGIARRNKWWEIYQQQLEAHTAAASIIQSCVRTRRAKQYKVQLLEERRRVMDAAAVTLQQEVRKLLTRRASRAHDSAAQGGTAATDTVAIVEDRLKSQLLEEQRRVMEAAALTVQQEMRKLLARRASRMQDADVQGDETKRSLSEEELDRNQPLQEQQQVMEAVAITVQREVQELLLQRASKMHEVGAQGGLLKIDGVVSEREKYEKQLLEEQQRVMEAAAATVQQEMRKFLTRRASRARDSPVQPFPTPQEDTVSPSQNAQPASSSGNFDAAAASEDKEPLPLRKSSTCTQGEGESVPSWHELESPFGSPLEARGENDASSQRWEAYSVSEKEKLDPALNFPTMKCSISCSSGDSSLSASMGGRIQAIDTSFGSEQNTPTSQLSSSVAYSSLDYSVAACVSDSGAPLWDEEELAREEAASCIQAIYRGARLRRKFKMLTVIQVLRTEQWSISEPMLHEVRSLLAKNIFLHGSTHSPSHVGPVHSALLCETHVDISFIRAHGLGLNCFLRELSESASKEDAMTALEAIRVLVQEEVLDEAETEMNNNESPISRNSGAGTERLETALPTSDHCIASVPVSNKCSGAEPHHPSRSRGLRWRGNHSAFQKFIMVAERQWRRLEPRGGGEIGEEIARCILAFVL